MARKISIAASLMSVALWFGTVGCSSDDASPDGGGGGGGGQAGEKVVEIFSWWVAPGEAEALQSLVDLDKLQHPEARVYNAAADSGDDARAMLAQRLSDHEPPDLFQQNAHDLPAFLEKNPGSLEALDDFFIEQGLDTAVDPDIIQAVSVGGGIYAMPVNIHRENALFYNRQIFRDHGLEPPTTFDELMNVCRTLKAEGVTPFATAYQGWILRIMFNSLAMGSMGSDSFHAFMTGGARDQSGFEAAIDVFGDVLENYVNEDATGTSFGWTDAAEAVADGRAAMFFHGDWAKGYYVQLGFTPGVDFGVVGATGATDLFWYGVDTFSLPVGATNRAGAYDFLQTVGSLRGQVAFNRLKGSSPIRADVPRQDLDSEGQATLDDFENARYRVLVVSKNAWDDALLEFAVSRDKAALLEAYAQNPPGE